MSFHALVEGMVLLLEVAGVLVLAGGSAWTAIRAVRTMAVRGAGTTYDRFRRDTGRSILLGSRCSSSRTSSSR